MARPKPPLPSRARELATGIENPSEQLSIYYGLWAGSFVRGGELAALREASSAALELANRYPGTGEAAVALRMHGMTDWYQGDFANARIRLERALAAFDPKRDGDLAFRFGQDIGVSIMNYLALTLWPIGEIGRARELQDAAIARAGETGHVATTAYAASYRSARCPCWMTFSRLLLSSPVRSSTSAWTVSLNGCEASTWLNSFTSSIESAAKLLTKLSGFLISCAIPA